MVSFEDIESILEEWFCDYADNGNVAVAKLYTLIDKLNEKNLTYFLENKDGEHTGSNRANRPYD